MPVRLTRPSVGLMPTTPLAPAGQTIEPSVSVPTATVARFAAAATPDPELEPHGLRSSAYGLLVWPPTALQPLDDWNARKLAHSDRFALPRMIAPAARSRSTMKASGGVLSVERQRSRGRRHARGVDVVLDDDRDAEHRQLDAVPTGAVGRTGVLDGGLAHRDDRVELAVELVDAPKVEAHEVHR